MAKIKKIGSFKPLKPIKPVDKMQNMKTMRPMGATKWIKAHWRWDYSSHTWTWVLGHWSK